MLLGHIISRSKMVGIATVRLVFLVLVSFPVLAHSQDPLLLRWNDTLLIDDHFELIYHDEIVMRTGSGNASADGPGVLICRVSTPDTSAGWRRPDDTVIATGNLNSDFHQYIRLVGRTNTTRVQLARARNLLQGGASNNGLWTCNGGGNPPRHVPLYTRGAGSVMIDSVSLGPSPSFSSSSPRFTLIADSSGGPPTNFSWRNDAGTISNGGSNSISIEVNPNNDATGRMNCHYRSTLEVTAVAPGTYTFLADNRATSGNARMSFVVEGGDPSNLQVTGTGSNSVELTWDPPPGPPSRGYRVMDSGNNIDMTTTSTSLTIDRLPPGVYNFRVIAISQHFPGTFGPGTATVSGAALPPLLSLSSPTATSVTVSWIQPVLSMPVTSYDVAVRRLTGCYSVTNIRGPRIQAANDMAELFEGLGEYIDYRAEVTANFQSASSVRAELNFTTSAIAPSEVPSNVVPTTTSRSISVSWDAIDCGNRNGPNFRYEVDFQRMDGGAVPVRTVNDAMFIVMGLQPFTNYTFRVRGVNDAGNGGYTGLTTIQTNGEAPEVPDNVRVSTLTSRTISVSWDPVNPNGANFHYNVDFQRMDGGAVPVGIVNNELFTVIGLQPFTNYTFRVRGVNDAGNGDYTSLKIIQTNELQAPSAIPSNVMVLVATSRTISISWDFIDSSSTNFRYEVDFQRMDGGLVPIETVNDMIFTVMGLQPFTNYTFRVRGVNDAGNGNYTNVRQIQTDREVPDVPDNVMVLTVTSRSIRVSWNAISPSGTNFRYEVDFQRTDGGTVSTGSVNNTVFSVEELQPYTSYTFRVRGVNAVGPGAYTQSSMIQTNSEEPGVIAGIESHLTSYTSVLVSWSPPQEPNGIIIMYELTYRLTEQCPMSENITNRLNFTILAEVNSRVTGIRVRAYTSVGPGPFAMTAPVTLTPSMVVNVQVESLTDTSVIVTWDRITDSPEIAEYIVYYAPVSSSRKRQDNEQSVTVPSTENSVVISGLESTVEYQYQVTAVALVFGGLRLEGERSPVTHNTRLMNSESGTSVAVSVSVIVTFLVTIILYSALLLIGCIIFHAQHSKNTKKITAETSGIALKENAAYGPVTSSQKPHDYIYDQPDVKGESEYDIVK